MSEEKRGGYREQLQEFIECYRTETCLWKTKSKDYHDRAQKNAAYKRLIKKYKSIDPNANRDIVVKKINNLRTTYKKELNKMKKSSSGVYTPRLWYFELLSFLYDQDAPKTSNTADEDENENQSTASISSTGNERDTPSPNHFYRDQNTPTLNYMIAMCNERISPTANRSDSQRTAPISSHCQQIKGNILAEDVLKSVNEYFKQPKIPDNRFEIFGKNVAMKLQELPNEQRIIAEKIINETLFLAELGSLTLSHSVRKNNEYMKFEID